MDELELMIKENEEKEAELRVLHSQLDASSSTYGDYNMSKAVEKLIVMLSDDNCDIIKTIQEWANIMSANMSDKIIERNNIRNRIIELEKELTK